jgi:hypothetical protein
VPVEPTISLLCKNNCFSNISLLLLLFTERIGAKQLGAIGSARHLKLDGCMQQRRCIARALKHNQQSTTTTTTCTQYSVNYSITINNNNN